MASNKRRKTTQSPMNHTNEETLGFPEVLDSDSESEELDFRGEAEAEVLKTYKRLTASEIRLLQLLPGKTGEDVCCSLITTKIELKPRYEAISYAWGLSHNLLPIVLNGKRCLRGHNLLACLENLRDENESRTLWVDALCINQNDTEERNAQIKIMPLIYRSAFRTLIWLGDDDEYSFYYFSASMKGLMPVATPHFSESLHFIERFAKDQHFHYTEQTAALIHGLQLICKFDWWSRMWVVQETLLSASAYVILGKAMMSWDTVCQAAASLLHHMSTCCRQSELYVEDRKYEKSVKDDISICVEVILSFQRIPYQTKNDLLAHLWTFRNRLASVKHDKVYGIMGLLRHRDFLLEPDYEEHFSALCRSVIIKDIQLSNNLNALQGIRESDSSDVTSWSIDWSYLDYWSEDRLRVLNSIYKQVYCTSLHHTPQVSEHDIKISGYWALRVAGRVLDRVVYTTHLLDLNSGIMGNKNYKHISEALQSLVTLRNKSSNTSYIAGGSCFNAFWRTLLANCIIPHPESHGLGYALQDSNSRQHQPSVRRANSADFFAFMLWMLSVSGGHFRKNKIMLPIDSYAITTPTREYSVEETLSYQHAAEQIHEVAAVQRIGASVIRATSGRCMFVTEQGYIGLGPHSLKSGDSIAILLGGCTPFALERGDIEGCKEEHWKLLGDCYVHGWMDGELVQNENTQDWGNVVLV